MPIIFFSSGRDQGLVLLLEWRTSFVFRLSALPRLTHLHNPLNMHPNSLTASNPTLTPFSRVTAGGTIAGGGAPHIHQGQFQTDPHDPLTI